MSAHTCAERWCTRPADIKVGGVGICARHFKTYAGWWA